MSNCLECGHFIDDHDANECWVQSVGNGKCRCMWPEFRALDGDCNE